MTNSDAAWEREMSRKVSMSEHVALTLLQYRRRAIDEGLKYQFRVAWQKIWNALHVRSLPPDESPDTFGELRFTTRNVPRHRVCIACVLPLAIHFVVHDEMVQGSDEIHTIVTIIRIDPMFKPM